MVFLCSCGGLIWENRVHVCGHIRCSCGGIKFDGRGHCCGYKPDYSVPPTDYELWRGFRTSDEWIGSTNWGKRSPSLFNTKNQETSILNSASAIEDIKSIKQTGSFQDYCVSFDNLLTKVILSEGYATSLFVGGLKPEIMCWVKFLRPKTLDEAYEMAKNQVNLFAILDDCKEYNTVGGKCYSASDDREFTEIEIQAVVESENGANVLEIQNEIQRPIEYENGKEIEKLVIDGESRTDENDVSGLENKIGSLKFVKVEYAPKLFVEMPEEKMNTTFGDFKNPVNKKSGDVNELQKGIKENVNERPGNVMCKDSGDDSKGCLKKNRKDYKDDHGHNSFCDNTREKYSTNEVCKHYECVVNGSLIEPVDDTFKESDRVVGNHEVTYNNECSTIARSSGGMNVLAESVITNKIQMKKKGYVKLNFGEIDTTSVAEVLNNINNSKNYLNELRSKLNNEFEGLYKRVIENDKNDLFCMPFRPIFSYYDTMVTTCINVMGIKHETDVLKERGKIETSETPVATIVLVDWRIKMIKDDGLKHEDKKRNNEEDFVDIRPPENFSIHMEGCHTFWLSKLMFKYRKKEFQNNYNTTLESTMIPTLMGSSATFPSIHHVPLALSITYSRSNLEVNKCFFVSKDGSLDEGINVNVGVTVVKEFTEPFSRNKNISEDEEQSEHMNILAIITHCVAAKSSEGLPPMILYCSIHTLKILLFASLHHIPEVLPDGSREDFATDLVYHALANGFSCCIGGSKTATGLVLKAAVAAHLGSKAANGLSATMAAQFDSTLTDVVSLRLIGQGGLSACYKAVQIYRVRAVHTVDAYD